MILVGNKSDIDKKREVSYEQGKDFSDKYGLVFYETSAKTSENIKEVFIEMTKELIKKNYRNEKIFLKGNLILKVRK
jgi:Ras-related protein Rab-2A